MYNIVVLENERKYYRLIKEATSSDKEIFVLEGSQFERVNFPLEIRACLISPDFIAQNSELSELSSVPKFLMVDEGRLPAHSNWSAQIKGLLRLGDDNRELPDILRMAIKGYSVFSPSLKGLEYQLDEEGETLSFTLIEYRIICKIKGCSTNEKIREELGLSKEEFLMYIKNISGKMISSSQNEGRSLVDVLRERELVFHRFVGRQSRPSFVVAATGLAI